MERVISDIITKTFDTMDEIFTSFVVMNKYDELPDILFQRSQSATISGS